MHREYVDVRIEKEVYEILKYWNEKRKEEMKEDKNLCTREPIYKVQRQIWIEASKESAEKEEFYIDCESFMSLEDIKDGCLDDDIQEQKEEFLDQEQIEIIKSAIKECNSLEEVEETLSEYEIEFENNGIWYSKEDWDDQGHFMTYEEAKEYQKYQKHNLGVSRVYVESPGYGNKGSLDKFLQILDHNFIFQKISFWDKLKKILNNKEV